MLIGIKKGYKPTAFYQVLYEIHGEYALNL